MEETSLNLNIRSVHILWSDTAFFSHLDAVFKLGNLLGNVVAAKGEFYP